MLVSLARTVIGTVFTIVCAAFPAYCFSRDEYWHKKIFYRFVIITMYFSAGVIPTFLTYKTIGIYDTLGLCASLLCNAFQPDFGEDVYGVPSAVIGGVGRNRRSRLYGALYENRNAAV